MHSLTAFLLLGSIATQPPCLVGKQATEPLLDTRAAGELIASDLPTNRSYRIHGRVLYCGKDFLILDDRLGQIYVSTSGPASWKAGDLVTAVCRTVSDWHYRAGTVAKARSVSVDASGDPPVFRPATPTDVVHGKGFQLMLLEGILTDVSADEIDPEWSILRLEDDHSTAFVWMRNSNSSRISIESLLDAQIRLRGIRFPGCDLSSRHYIGPWILADEASPPEIVRSPMPNPAGGKARHPHRQLLTGTVLANWNGNQFFLKTDSGRIIEVHLTSHGELPSVGTRLTVAGFVRHNTFFTYLTNSQVREKTGGGLHPETPCDTTIAEIFRTGKGIRRLDPALNGRLLRLTGTVTGFHNPTKEEWIMRLEDNSEELDVCTDSHPELPIGARVRVSGIGRLEVVKNPLRGDFVTLTGLSVLVRAPDDIEILAYPPWWTPDRLRATIGILALILGIAVVWNASLRILVRRRSRQLLRESVERIEANMRTEERTRLAVELHDTIAQNLTGAALEINATRRILDKGSGDCRPHLDRAEKTITSCRQELGNCIWDLRNETLAVPDLAEAIRQTIAPHVGNASLRIRFNVSRTRLTDNTAHALLRILRELCANAVRHGKANVLRIAGSIADERLLFSVRDNGCGFDPESAPGIANGHFGLQGIRERATRLGGNVKIVRMPDGGMRISVSFAIHHPQGHTAT